MDDKIAYSSGDYSSQIKAMDANMSALERNLLNFTLWTYCSDNCNKWGDQWNGEDLSLWSRPKSHMKNNDLILPIPNEKVKTEHSDRGKIYMLF